MKPLAKYQPCLNGSAFAGMFSADGLYTGDDYTFYLASDVDPLLASHGKLVNSLMAMIEAYEHTIAAEYGYGWEKIAEGKHYLQAAKASLAAAEVEP